MLLLGGPLAYAGGGCTPLPCAEILIELPLELEFDRDHGHLADGDGTVKNVSAQEGTQIKKGQLLVELELDEAD